VSHAISLLSDQVDEREVRVVLRELEKVLGSDVPGDVVEFGCYVGTTSVFLAERLKGTPRQLYLYDSFEGLPPKSSQDESPAGLQFKTGELLATKKQLVKNLKQRGVPMPVIKKAWFSELADRDVPGVIAFAFLDGDYYHSVRDPLKLIWNHLAPGAIIVVDDYANEALPGAAKAVDEWLFSHQGRLRVEHSLGIIHT
jgi:O-methyltransferase